MTAFQNPWFFALSIIVAGVIANHYWRRKKRTPALRFSSVESIKAVPKSWRAQWIDLPFWLRIASVVLMIIGLARPQSADTKIRRDVDGIDIILLVDLSLTMMIEDMSGNSRLDAAKQAQIEFVKNRPNDRIGIVAFAGEAFTSVPLTFDHKVVIEALQRLDNSNRLKDGTAQGVAIATGVARLQDSTAKSRIMVFITDGENNTGFVDPDTALQLAKGYGIKIYVVGVGSDGPKRLPIRTKDVFGNWVKTYQDMESTFHEEKMKEIASQTGGKYWRSRNLEELHDVYNEIDQLEKSKIESSTLVKYTELFPPAIWASLLLYLLSFLLSRSLLQRGPA